MLLAWEDSQMLLRALGEVAAGACALLFLAAALGKFDSWEQWSRLTKEIPAPAVLGRAVRVIVPAVESVVVVLSFAWPAAGLASGTVVLAVFALALRDRGWRITYLGADTPVETIEDAARALEPALVVVSASAPDRIEDSLGALRRLAKRAPLVFAGPGAASAKLPARGLAGDPLTEAERLTRERRNGA